MVHERSNLVQDRATELRMRKCDHAGPKSPGTLAPADDRRWAVAEPSSREAFEGTASTVKRMYYFSAGVALGAVATRRTRRAKDAARAALAARLTPSAIAADVADAIAEIGNAVGSFAADVRQGAANRRSTYRPMIDNATGAVALLAPDQAGPVRPIEAVIAIEPDESAGLDRRTA